MKGRCLPYGDGIAYWPLREVINQLVAVTPASDGLSALVAGDDGADVVVGHVLSAIGVSSAGSSSAEIQWAVRRLFELVARERPLVVVFEDVHWGEPVFLDLVEYVAGFSRGAPIVIACSARSELVEARPAWADGSAGSVLRLEPLSLLESEALLAQLPGDVMDADRRMRIATQAEGNPLFLEQLRAFEAQPGEAPGGRARLPETIQALLAARIDRLAAHERAVLERAAIEGRSFHRSAVVALSPEGTGASVGSLLMGLVRQELIGPDEPVFADDDGFRFRHILVRDVVYEQTAKELRADLHVRYAEWLEEQAGERVAEFEEIIGYHLEQAYRLRLELRPGDERALILARRAGQRLAAAGRRAYARFDEHACIALLARTAELLPRNDRARLEALPELASALIHGGQLERAELVLREAADHADDEHGRSLVAHARLLLPWLAFLRGSGASAGSLPRAASDALRAFDQIGDHTGRARAWRMVGVIEAMAGRNAAAADAFEDALAAAELAGDTQETASALRSLAHALLLGPTPVETAIGRCEQFLQPSAVSGAAPIRAHSEPGAEVKLSLATLYAMRGRFDDARTLAADGRAILEELGLRSDVAIASLQIGDVELIAGDVTAAERILRDGHEALEQMGEEAFRSTVAAFLAAILCAQHRDEEAERYVRISAELGADEDLITQVMWRTSKATILARRGAHDAAQNVADEAVRRADGSDMLTLRADARVALVDVLQLASRSEDAIQEAKQAVELYERKGHVVGAAAARNLIGGVAEQAAR